MIGYGTIVFVTEHLYNADQAQINFYYAPTDRLNNKHIKRLKDNCLNRLNTHGQTEEQTDRQPDG